METKKEIRKQIRKIRNQLEPDVWQRATEKITSNVIQSDNFREATDVLCYINIEGEVGTRQIIEEAWRLGKNVWVPKVFGDDMEFFCIHSFLELEEGAFGVPEPTGNGEKADLSYGLIIVPGIAFDHMRNRIGYGKGFY
ncbi:MAG: 5-formyltetrahydrofolate cyclo-ligase, partial [Lachnospiraceae bacterium]